MSWGRRRRGSYGGYFQRRPKVDLARIKRENPNIKPIVIEGRTISRTFWGKGWCDHFEGMADFDNRLPRGRTYARNGSVFHLEIGPGSIVANVAGSDVYTVKMEVDPLPLESWGAIIQKCHGRISTIIDLLKGQFSPEVMEVVCDPKNGLFPTAKEIRYNCSCPDWAHLCKHIAAIFYGIGNRLDTEPELLFLLR
ncbi:MAG: SWIM zinc finger family protein, partial [Deltaproteobacteria bacterium]|nr:SWIM zinc finger family protein [Deltaproteobacteria bacterium]